MPATALSEDMIVLDKGERLVLKCPTSDRDCRGGGTASCGKEIEEDALASREEGSEGDSLGGRVAGEVGGSLLSEKNVGPRS